MIGSAIEAIFPKLWAHIRIVRHDHNMEPEYWLLPKLCTPNTNAVDVGGNTGIYAYYLSLIAQRVDVFEPNPICLKQLSRIRTANMCIHGVALSDRHGEAVMRFDPNNTGIGTIEKRNRLRNNPGIRDLVERKVQTRRLDDMQLLNVGFIKIDVEGHEPAVVRGAIELIERDHPAILLECEMRHNATSFEELTAILGPLGYRPWRLLGERLKEVNIGEISDLQAGGPQTSKQYINNFIFLPESRPAILKSIGRI